MFKTHTATTPRSNREVARGLVAGDASAFAARLASLRHDAKFTKARRRREMDKRARTNLDAALRLDTALASLPPLERAALACAGPGGRELTCALTCEDAASLLAGDVGASAQPPDNYDDIMVWALRVCRPEHVVEAPGQIVVNRACVGAVYSHSAFIDASAHAHAEHSGGAAGATGGFAPSRTIAAGAAAGAASGGGGSGNGTASDSDDEHDPVGLFRGPDGALMNACMPLFLSTGHWARVRLQLGPLLGEFFCLDALAHAPGQLVALYAVLGQLAALQARGGARADRSVLRGEWGDWALADLAKLCAAARPLARKALRGGHGGAFSEAEGARGDLVADFAAATPTWRTRERVPSLLSIVGWRLSRWWAHENDKATTNDEGVVAVAGEGATRRIDLGYSADEAADDASAGDGVRDEKVLFALVEESWRRGLGVLHKGQPRTLQVEALERLLYGPPPADGGAAVAVTGTDSAPLPVPPAAATTRAERNDKRKDAVFSEYARHELGLLPKAQAAAAKKKWAKGAPADEGANSEDGSGWDYAPRRIVRYEEHADYFDALIEAELAPLEPGVRTLAPGLAAAFSRELGDDCDACARASALLLGSRGERGGTLALDGATRRLMLAQALRFSANDLANAGVADGSYVDTHSALRRSTAGGRVANNGDGGVDAAARAILEPPHAALEGRRTEKDNAAQDAVRTLATARRIVRTTDPLAFAGRMLAAGVRTRGGTVFDHVVSLLVTGRVDGGVRVPLLADKVRALLTGRLRVHDNNATDAPPVKMFARGESWVSCPLETARKLREAIGEDAFLAIELDMRGHWGHAYRVSDIPNRHGHHNSNPNPLLARSFRGFAM